MLAHRVALIPQHSVEAGFPTSSAAVCWGPAMAYRSGVLLLLFAPPVSVYASCDALPDCRLLLAVHFAIELLILQMEGGFNRWLH